MTMDIDPIERDAAIIVDEEAFRMECEQSPTLASAAKLVAQIKRGMLTDREAAHAIIWFSGED